MKPGALQPYEESLLSGGIQPLRLVADGRAVMVHLDVARWLSDVDAADEQVLVRCAGPVLDIGCGPGRFVRGLKQRGLAALGVDIANTAVELTRRAGGSAIGRSVFDPLPAEGHWRTVLLMDGNVGIGGDVARLLRRAAEVMSDDGLLIVECSPDPELDEVLSVRFGTDDGIFGPSFAWARIGAAALRRQAGAYGYSVGESFAVDERTFVCLRLSSATALM